VIVEIIAARNKLTASVAGTLKAIPVPHIDQTQESDAVFLSRLVDRNGATVSVKAGKLLFIKVGNAMLASGKTIPQMTLERGDGDRHQFAIADREAYTGVTAKWLHTKDPKPQKQKVKLKRKPKEQHLRALQHPKAVKAPAKSQAKKSRKRARRNIWPVSLTTFWSSRPSTRQRRRQSGTSCSVVLWSFQSRWRLAGQIYSLKRR
jgi:phage protein D